MDTRVSRSDPILVIAPSRPVTAVGISATRTPDDHPKFAGVRSIRPQRDGQRFGVSFFFPTAFIQRITPMRETWTARDTIAAQLPGLRIEATVQAVVGIDVCDVSQRTIDRAIARSKTPRVEYVD